MINDRGSIKWTSLMLPEHIEILKAIEQDDKKVQKPILDEQEMELINKQLIEADSQGYPIELSVFDAGIIKQYDGVVYLNKTNNTLKINDHVIKFTDIVSVNS